MVKRKRTSAHPPGPLIAVNGNSPKNMPVGDHERGVLVSRSLLVLNKLWHAAVTAAGIWALFVISLQPISSESLWWELSRGRQVLTTFTLWPSAELLVNETRGEANGIGSCVGFMAHMLLGTSGLMSIRLVVLGAFVVWFFWGGCRRRKKNGPDTSGHQLLGSPAGGPLVRLSMKNLVPWNAQLLLVVGTAFGLSRYFDPVPILYDMIAFAALGVLMQAIRSSCGNGLERELKLDDCGDHKSGGALKRLHMLLGFCFAIFAFWANFGNYLLVGLVALLIILLEITYEMMMSRAQNQGVYRCGCFLVAAAIGGSINPVGHWVWHDSLVQSIPWAFAPGWTMKETAWLPLMQVSWTRSEYVFLVLTCVWAAKQFCWRDSTAMVTVTLVLHFLAWTSSALVPLAMVWMTWQCSWGMLRQPVAVRGNPSGKSSPELNAVAKILRWVAVQFVPGALILIIALVSNRTSGWGIEANLDPRMLQMAIGDAVNAGTVLAVDLRSAGMAAWVIGPAGPAAAASGDPRLQDEPERSLIGGRLVNQERILTDLRAGRLMRYWRADDSPGGWWLPLTAQDTSIIVCSRRALTLIRALEPTIWKPLSLDSPVIPFARAGDPLHNSRMIEILKQRQLVDSGPWAYSPPQSSGSPFDRDRFGLRAVVINPAIVFDQAELFASMELHTAALRTLSYGNNRWPSHNRFLPLWQRIQIELADAERKQIGLASLMRTLAAGYEIYRDSITVEEKVSDPDGRSGPPSASHHSPPSASHHSPPSASHHRGQSPFPKTQILASRRIKHAFDPPGRLIKHHNEPLGSHEISRWNALILLYRDQGAERALAISDSILRDGDNASQWPNPTVQTIAQLRYAAVCWAIEAGQVVQARSLAQSLLSDPSVSRSLRLLTQQQYDRINGLEDRGEPSTDESTDRLRSNPSIGQEVEVALP